MPIAFSDGGLRPLISDAPFDGSAATVTVHLMSGVEAACRHFRAVLAGAQVITEPFAHSFIEQVFPLEFYRTLRASLPPLSAYRVAPSEHGRTDEPPRRHDFWLASPFLDQLPPEHQDLWRDFAHHASRVETALALAGPYRRFLDPADESLQIEIRLVRESGPFVLDPHLDMEQKRLVAVVYLADEDAPESLGTTLYSRDGDRFVAATTTPYRANCASTMLRTPDAWHGGEWQALTGERHTMHLYVHRSP